MTSLRVAPLGLIALTLIACSTERTPERDASVEDRADAPSEDIVDTQVFDAPLGMDAEALDSAPPPDADLDASAPDVDMVEDGAATDTRGDVATDATPFCPCPPIPLECAPPVVDEPTFTPRDDSLQRQLNDVIACATTTLDMALYEANSSCFVNVVLARLSAAPSLHVRIITDDERCPLVMGVRQCELSRLASHPRVQIIDDARSALMHHKFIVADGARLWIGSANITRRSFCTDENNAMVIEDPGVVATFASEFRRMFELRMFGPVMPEPAPSPTARFAVYFSPRSPTTQAPAWYAQLIASIQSASRSLEFAVSAFTRQDIADALIAAHRRGVRVRGIVSALYAMDPSIRSMRLAGLDVRAAEMHSKVLVIDGTTVVTRAAA